MFSVLSDAIVGQFFIGRCNVGQLTSSQITVTQTTVGPPYFWSNDFRPIDTEPFLHRNSKTKAGKTNIRWKKNLTQFCEKKKFFETSIWRSWNTFVLVSIRQRNDFFVSFVETNVAVVEQFQTHNFINQLRLSCCSHGSSVGKASWVKVPQLTSVWFPVSAQELGEKS